MLRFRDWNTYRNRKRLLPLFSERHFRPVNSVSEYSSSVLFTVAGLLSRARIRASVNLNLVFMKPPEWDIWRFHIRLVMSLIRMSAFGTQQAYTVCSAGSRNHPATEPKSSLGEYFSIFVICRTCAHHLSHDMASGGQRVVWFHSSCSGKLLAPPLDRTFSLYRSFKGLIIK